MYITEEEEEEEEERNRDYDLSTFERNDFKNSPSLMLLFKIHQYRIP